MLFIKQVIFVFILFLSSSLFSQSCDLVLKGQVLDEDNSQDLGYAVVRVLDHPTVMQTNEKGEFEIKDLCPGKYRILVQHVGCSDTIFAITINKSKKVVFKLPHNLNALNDIEIVAEHEEIKPVHSSHVLEGKSLDQVKGMNLAEQLRQVNGVSALSTGPTISKPMINGMQGYRILILNNGIRQEGQQWGSEHGPEIDPFVAQRLTVIRGASSVRYGSDALGGVILVEPDHLPDTASVTGEFNAGGFSNGRGGAGSLMLQGSFAKLKYFSWRVQGSLKKSGSVKTPEYFLNNTGLEEQNFSYALSYHRKKGGVSVYYSQVNSRIGIFSGAHVGNLTDLQLAFKRNKPADSLAPFSYSISSPFQQVFHELLKVSSDFHTGNRSRIFVTYALQHNKRQEFDAHGEHAEELTPESEYRLTTHSAEIFWEHDHIRSFRGRVGVQGTYQENVYRENFFIPNYISSTTGVFAMERFVRSKFEAEAGIRFDAKNLQSFYYKEQQLQEPKRDFSNMSYHAGLILKPVNSVRLSFNGGTGWRAPSVNELYSNGLHHGVSAYEKGNADLGIETCWQAAASLLFKHKKITAEINAYNYWFKNYIYYVPSPEPEVTLRGAFPVFNYTQNDARLSGADVMLSYFLLRNLAIKGRAIYVRGINANTNEPLIYMPADRYEAGLTFTFSDKGVFRNMFIEPAVTYVAKQTRVPQDLDFLPPPDAYFLVGVSAGSTIRIKQMPLTISLTVANLTNTVYRDYLDRFRYFNDAAGTNVWLRLKMPFVLYDKK
jgi:iron complex outermembrane receptor protein